MSGGGGVQERLSANIIMVGCFITECLHLRRIQFYNDVMLLAEVAKFLLSVEWMYFDLVDSRQNSALTFSA